MENIWICECGQENTDKFCSACGTSKRKFVGDEDNAVIGEKEKNLLSDSALIANATGKLNGSVVKRQDTVSSETIVSKNDNQSDNVVTSQTGVTQQLPTQKNNMLYGIIGVLVVAVLCMGGYLLLDNDKQVPVQYVQKEQTYKTIVSDKNKEIDASKNNVNSIREKFAELVVKKDVLDTEIASVAVDINNYLSNHKDFKGTASDGILNKIKSTLDKVETAQNELSKLKVTPEDEAVKSALLKVYDCEAGRIRGLYKGVLDSRNNGDYMLGFKEGTKSSYKFDEENATFNAMYKK